MTRLAGLVAGLFAGLFAAIVLAWSPPAHAAAGWVDGSISENGTVCQYTATTSDVPPNPLWIDHTTLQTSCDNGCVWTNNPDVTFDDVAGTAVIGELDFTCTTTFGITCSYRVTNIVLYRVGTSRTYTGGPFTGTKTGGSFLCPSSVSLDSITMTFHSST